MSKIYQSYYDVARFVLWADSPSEDNKRARFVLGFRDGNPRFIVYTGGQGKEAVINFPMDNIHLTAAMNQLKDIATGPAGEKVYLESLVPVYENDKRTNQKKVLATLVMGKSKEGVVYMSVLMEGRPAIVFPISPSPSHVFRNSNKEPMNPEAVSKLMAIGVANIILDTVARVMVDYTNEEYDNGPRKPAPIKPAGGGNNGDGRGKPTPPQFSDLDDIL